MVCKIMARTAQAIFNLLLCLLSLHPKIVESSLLLYYCHIEASTIQNVNKLRYMEFDLIPRTTVASVQSGKEIDCNWKIPNNKHSDVVLILSGINRRVGGSVQPGDEAMKYELHGSATNCSSNTNKSAEPVKLETLRVLQLPRGSYLNVTYRLKSNDNRAAGLKIRLIEPGFCGPEFPSFDSSCFTATSVRRSLSEELTALNVDSIVMRLASFNSSSSLQSFVRESQRIRVGSEISTRLKIPLDLSNRLRIGMFYLPSNKSVFYLRHSGDSCAVEIFKDNLIMNFSVQSDTASGVLCGSLSASASVGVDGALGRVFFGDCSEPLPALIGFEAVVGTRCANCSRAVEHWMEEIPPLSKLGFGIYIIVGVTLLVVCSAAVIATVLCLSRTMKGQCPAKLVKAESLRLMNERREADEKAMVNSELVSLKQQTSEAFGQHSPDC